MPDPGGETRAEKRPDDEVSVTLLRRDWLVIIAAARDYDRRVPADQGDGGACLDRIQEALDA